MTVYEIIGVCKVSFHEYIKAKDKKEAKKKYKNGEAFGYEELDSWDYNIVTIERIYNK